MYNSYKLVIMTLNTKGNENTTAEDLYKEEDGVLRPMTKEEAVLKMLKETSTTGGNPATQEIKTILLNPNGNIEKIEEVIKPVVVTE